MKQPINWQDRVVEYPNRYQEVTDSDGFITHVKKPGEVLHEGTPQNATNFNNMDMGIVDGIYSARFNAMWMRWLQEHVDARDKEIEETHDAFAKNFNEVLYPGLQSDIADAFHTGAATAEYVRHLADKVTALDGEILSVTLTNTAKYPLNNSGKTVALSLPRPTKKYSVTVELVGNVGGGVGQIEITDKLENGFKVRYTGAATSVTLNCIVRGGI